MQLLVVVAVLGVIGTIGLGVYHNLRPAISERKLDMDVKQLNEAVRMYLASGGDLEGIEDPRKVIEHLKTAVSAEQEKSFVGFKGNPLDLRLQAVVVDSAEISGSWARWDGASQRFVVGEGDPGVRGPIVKRFVLGEASVAQTVHREETIRYARSSNWVWDYGDYSLMKLGPAPQDLGQSSPFGGGPVSPSTAAKLQPPQISLPGGEYPLTLFGGSTITLSNPNPTGVSQLFVSGGGSSWVYERGFQLQPGLEISTYAVSLDPDRYTDSELQTHRYTVRRVKLEAQIAAARNTFSYVELGGAMRSGGEPASPDRTIGISVLENAEIPARFHHSRYYDLGWTTDGSHPTSSATRESAGAFSGAPASGSITLGVDHWPAGQSTISLRARATSLDRKIFIDSDEESLTLRAAQLELGRPLLSRDDDEVTLDFDPAARLPADAYIIYTTEGFGASAAEWQRYEGPFEADDDDTVVGRMVVPDRLSAWWSPSDTVPSSAPSGEFLGESHFDLDTSTFIADIGSGKTGAHSHEYNVKYGVGGADFFDLKDGKLTPIQDAVPPGRRFKIIVINGDLSPAGRLFINAPYHPNSSGAQPVAVYDDQALADLPIYSLNGVPGSQKLESFSLYFSEDAMALAQFLPSNTGDVKKNQPGPNGEWRNGALTIQVVEVNGDGSDNFTTNVALSNGGVQGAATNGLLWEATFFWHWDGPSFHDDSPYVPGDPSSVEEYLED